MLEHHLHVIYYLHFRIYTQKDAYTAQRIFIVGNIHIV